MDQKKIGGFIAEKRRTAGWTQSRLAGQLGVTDKAVSKWETGRAMPDLALFHPLCTLLGITLNELLAGEHIPQNELPKRAEQQLYELLAHWLGQERAGAASLPMEEPLLRVEGVSRRYLPSAGGRPAVDEVSFGVEKGRFVGIMGASGCGKTTLLNLIGTIDRPDQGHIFLNGQEITALTEARLAQFRQRHLGFVFQDYGLLDDLTLYENIAMALAFCKTPEKEVQKRVDALAERFGITEQLQKLPCEVSGGQRQRCACARALAGRPSLILADEPTGALDSEAARQLLESFSRLCQTDGAAILMVTHDAFAASWCDRVLFMRDGRITAVLERNSESKQGYFARILKQAAESTGGVRHAGEADSW